MLEYDQEVKVGNAVFRFPAGSPPRGLAAVLAGKPPPRGRRKPAAMMMAVREGQEAAYERAIASGCWAPAPPQDLTRSRADAIVVALNTNRRRQVARNQEVHHMSNTATTARRSPNGAKPKPASKGAGITAMQAAEQVLRKADGPMKVSEIATAAVKLRAFKPTGKTPEASVAARVHVSAKLPDGVFVRVDRGVVDLRELNPKAKAKRPAAAQPVAA